MWIRQRFITLTALLLLAAALPLAAAEGRLWPLAGASQLLALPAGATSLGASASAWRVDDASGVAIVRVIEDDANSPELAAFQGRCEAVLTTRFQPTQGSKQSFLGSEANLRHFTNPKGSRHLRALFIKLRTLPVCVLIDGHDVAQVEAILSHLLAHSKVLEGVPVPPRATAARLLADETGRLLVLFADERGQPLVLRHVRIEVWGIWRRPEGDPNAEADRRLLSVTASSRQLSLLGNKVTIPALPDEFWVEIDGWAPPLASLIRRPRENP